MWSWFKRAVDTVSTDKFRIKVITLKDGTKKYYPQYKGEVSSSYLCLIKTGSDHQYIVLIDVSDHDLLNSNYYYYSDQEAAQEAINDYKLQLELERAKQLESEEIIKL